MLLEDDFALLLEVFLPDCLRTFAAEILVNGLELISDVWSVCGVEAEAISKEAEAISKPL